MATQSKYTRAKKKSSRKLTRKNTHPLKIIGITVCVNYDDILGHMLEQNLKFLHKWLIVTKKDDKKTIDMVEKCGNKKLKLLFYDGFYKNGAKFNFGGARLFAQNYIEKNYSSANVLMLDSDIYLPDNFAEKLPISLKDDYLYGIERIDYWTLKDFNTESNPHTPEAGPFCGFFQMYKQNPKYKYKDSLTAAECDIIFRKMFDKKKRIKLDIYAKHLGQNGANWSGRKYEDGVFYTEDK